MFAKSTLKNFRNNRIFRTIGNLTSPPRFFSKKEWGKFNDKEKIWITYKHYWMLKGQGDAEISVVEAIVMQFITWATLIMLWKLPIEIMFVSPFVLAFSWWLKFLFGDYKDKKDLIALEMELGNRRNKVFRELRKK